MILGITQDGGYPQVGCNLSCCINLNVQERFVSSAAIIDHDSRSYWLLDITPDFRFQVKLLTNYVDSLVPRGIFITHAHSGHYTGLIDFGKEVLNTFKIPIYVMNKMYSFLHENKPWMNLIKQNNIELHKMDNHQKINICDELMISPFMVSHRSEISETVGFKIEGNSKSIIYLPDIDDWIDFELISYIRNNNILFIDGTFFDKNEVSFRNINKIPHPSIKSTMSLVKNMLREYKERIFFIHLNHTNDALREDSEIYKIIMKKGFNIANQGKKINL